MRIAIVLNTSWNIYNFRLGLIKALQDREHEVIAVAPKDEYSLRLIEAGCRYEEVTMDSRGANPVKDIGLILELYTIYKRTRPDVILHFTIKPNIYGTIAARLLGIPCINNVCGLGTIFLKKNIVSLVAKLMYKIAFRFPKKIFFQNIEDRKLFFDKRLVSRGKTDLIPGSGLDLKKFLPEEYPENRKFTFLLISRLIYDKGILEYVEAIKRLKERGINARFQVLGPVDYNHRRGIPKDLVDNWINSQFFEYFGRKEDVREYIRFADCVVLPSYREGTPKSLLEAAGMARPVITTNVAGCKEVVSDGQNGLLCEPRNAEDLADKMFRMANLSREERKSMGQFGRKKIECEFREDLVIDKYLESIQNIKNA